MPLPVGEEITRQQAAAELLARRRARQQLLEFTRYTKPDFAVNWHHQLLAERLTALAAGQLKRLMVFMPPRHSKSELVSRRLPAFIHGINPDAKLIVASYAVSLASSLCRDTQRIIESEAYRRLFPATAIPGTAAAGTHEGGYRRTHDTYEVLGHTGSYYAVGVGGGITGRGFDVGIIDDPLKGAEEADSPQIRDKIWEWFNNDFLTRQMPGAAILLTMTRWHREDLAGRLLARMVDQPASERWEVLSLPAERGEEHNPLDPRQLGEPLWPARFDTAALAEFKRHPRTWQALYQQNPAPDGGAEWPEHCFGGDLWVDQPPRDTLLKVVALDPSKGRDAKSSDYSALIGLACTPQLDYVQADLARRNPLRIVEDLFTFCEQFRPDAVGFEANAFQELFRPIIEHTASDRRFASSHLTRLLKSGQGLFEIENRLAKAVRIRSLSEPIINRRFRFVRNLSGQLLVDQLRDFPRGEYDDGPDALEMAVRLARQLLS